MGYNIDKCMVKVLLSKRGIQNSDTWPHSSKMLYRPMTTIAHHTNSNLVEFQNRVINIDRIDCLILMVPK